MKILLLTLFVFTVLLVTGYSQQRTGEKKWTIDPVTGDTVFTESVIISQSEDITPRNNIIIVNPLKFLLFYNISYFHKINDGTAIGGGIQIPTLSGINGFGINAEARFYPSGKNLKGFYLSPNFSYNNLSSEHSDNSVSISSIGGLIGWQWFPGEQFAIGLGIGVDYYFFKGSDPEDDFGKINGTAPALRFDIGYAW
jgi:hypothetical protein